MKTKDNNDLFITEISESDFRKLDIIGYELKMVEGKMKWLPRSMNEYLDAEIDMALRKGYESDLENLQCPFTVAIHKDNCDHPDDYYLDKFMNRFTGPRTYQIGFGIKHLFSTRDYFEDHEDYWRVSKRETKSVYRVHLDKKWIDEFELKHK